MHLYSHDPAFTKTSSPIDLPLRQLFQPLGTSVFSLKIPIMIQETVADLKETIPAGGNIKVHNPSAKKKTEKLLLSTFPRQNMIEP